MAGHPGAVDVKRDHIAGAAGHGHMVPEKVVDFCAHRCSHSGLTEIVANVESGAAFF